MKTFAKGDYVNDGKPYTEDYDEGVVVEVCDDGAIEVAWESGVVTRVAPASLRPGRPGLWAPLKFSRKSDDVNR